jgi:integrase
MPCLDSIHVAEEPQAVPQPSSRGQDVPMTAGATDAIVAAATPSPIQAGAIVSRRRFQRGTSSSGVRLQGATACTAKMFCNQMEHSSECGGVSCLARSAASRNVLAWRAFQPYLDRVNTAAKMPPKSGMTLETFVKEWRTNVAVNLKNSTTRAAESHLRAHLLPKLGSLTLTEINTEIVQAFVAYLATGGRSKKTVENVLLTLSSILRKAKAWDYACGSFSLAEITMPREGVRKEQRCFTDEEVGTILAAAPEPFGTILALTSVLGLRIGEVLALRVSDVDFSRKIGRVRQSIDAATRKVQAVKSNASSADVPMPTQLEARLRKHLQTHDGKTDLLFTNRRGRPYSANKLRAKTLHPLLVKLGIPLGGFHSMRHGAASALLADGATPAVVQKQLRHSDPRITLGVYAHVIGSQQRDTAENRSARIEQFAVN